MGRVSTMKLGFRRTGMSKIMFIIVSLLLVAFLGSIILTFVGDFITSAVGGGSPMSVVSDLLGGI
jgi:preprotein translocase subunit SecY